MNHRPKSFIEWRALLHETWMNIGLSVTWMLHRKEIQRLARTQGLKPASIDRDVWRLAHRAYRIEQHLNAEFDAGTTGAMTELLKMLDMEDDE